VNTITVPSRVNLTSGNFTIVEVNNNMATLEDGDGNVYRDIPCVATLAGEGGGGGGSGLPDQTGHSGEFLTTDGTDASWAPVDALPDQTGQNGKFLTTDGTDASWTTINAMSNSATDGQSIAALASDYVRNLISITGNKSYVFGAENYNGIQHSTLSGDGIVLIGGKIQSNTNISTKNWTVLNGYTALDSYVNVPGEFSLSVYGMAKGTRSIQLGLGTNSDANTMKIGVTSGNYEIMSADGTIPEARLADTTNAQQGDVLTLDSTGNAVWQAGGSGGGLPSQTGNAGKFLTTDGTDASWSDKPLVNTNPTTSTTVIIGNNNGSVSSVGNNAICLTHMGSYGGWIALGNNAIAIGSTKNSLGAYSINIGGSSCAGNYAIQLGGNGINTDANTFKVGNNNGNFEIMSADGTIPTARLTKVNTTITLTAAGWSSNTQTVSVTGMTATGVVMVSPDPTDQSAYTSAGIICSAQAAGTLTFTCSTTPSADLSVNVVML
jgi:hypothetical protein